MAEASVNAKHLPRFTAEAIVGDVGNLKRMAHGANTVIGVVVLHLTGRAICGILLAVFIYEISRFCNSFCAVNACVSSAFGAAIGAMAGSSVCPVVGTLVGAGVGIGVGWLLDVVSDVPRKQMKGIY